MRFIKIIVNNIDNISCSSSNCNDCSNISIFTDEKCEVENILNSLENLTINSDDPKCTATTAVHTRCKNKRLDGTLYCKQHHVKLGIPIPTITKIELPRMDQTTPCPFNGSNKILCDNESCTVCLNRSMKSSPSAYRWSSRNILTARQVTKGSNKEYYFDCNRCKHTELYSAAVMAYSTRHICAYCSNRKLCDDLNCNFCFEASFASHPMAKNWSKKNNIMARMVLKSSYQKTYFFDCDVCKHTYETYLNRITNGGTQCLYCTNTLLCDDLSCNFCRNNSFESCEESIHWSPENTVTPRQVLKNSHKDYKFICHKCKHTFEMCPRNVSRGAWCPYCAHQKICPSEAKCNICISASFASIKNSKYFAEENEIKACEIYPNNRTLCIFNCPYCKGKFKMEPAGITSGSFCPCINNKTEFKIYKFIEGIYPDTERDARFEWAKYINHLPYDIYIPHWLIIECDGSQHFREVPAWGSLEDRQKKDIYKMILANQHNLSIIRIEQTYAKDDRNPWGQDLLNAIRICIESMQQGVIINQFIGKIYDQFPSYKNLENIKEKPKLDLGDYKRNN